MHAASSSSSAFAPLTAAAILDAKLDQLQSRLAHLWAAAHSPLALQQPIVASLYMRQLRLLAFHGDIQFSTAHTQLNFCSRCCQVHIPAVNVDVHIAPSRERKRRDKRRSRRRQWALKQSQVTATLGADATMDEAPSATDSDAAVTPRKRKRSASPATPARPLASSGVDSSRSHTAHEIVYRCHTCGQVDRASGISHRQRQLVRESNTDLDALVANAAERDAQPALEEAKQAAAKKQRLLQSLQTQTAVSAPIAPKPNLASLHMLSQAQHKFEQAKATLQHQSKNNHLAGASTAATAMAMQSTTSNSFFAEQFKNAAGIASTPAPSPPPHTPSKPFSFTAGGAKAAAAASSSLIQPPPAPAAAAAPFSFSRSGTASTAPKIGGGSLYSLLQSATAAPPAAPLHVPITSAPSAPFSFSAPPKTPQQPKSKAQTPKTPGSTPAPSTSLMQGIAIIGGIGSSATPSKTYTVTTKGGGKNNAVKKKY